VRSTTLVKPVRYAAGPAAPIRHTVEPPTGNGEARELRDVERPVRAFGYRRRYRLRWDLRDRRQSEEGRSRGEPVGKTATVEIRPDELTRRSELPPASAT